MRFRSLDHVGVVVADLDRSVRWWSTFLEREPFEKGTWRAADTQNYVGRILGYEDCDIAAAFWSLPGGSVLEMIEYLNPPAARVDMETYNAGNTHLCFETPDIQADYERMAGLAQFRSPQPVTSIWGPYKGSQICYLRDPDGISIELVQFADGRPFEADSPYGHPYADGPA